MYTEYNGLRIETGQQEIHLTLEASLSPWPSAWKGLGFFGHPTDSATVGGVSHTCQKEDGC